VQPEFITLMPAPLLDNQMLDAGRRALERFGYAGATAERIAEEAGVSRVTLHRRGVSKDTILATLVERATEQYRAAMWLALTAWGNARERMQLALGALCDAAAASLDLLIALRPQADVVFHEDAESEALTRGVFTEPLERLLRDGAADGSLRPVDPVETARVLFNLVGWTYVYLCTGHRWPRRGPGRRR
jgi:AcrR family transcriptional regulator